MGIHLLVIKLVIEEFLVKIIPYITSSLELVGIIIIVLGSLEAVLRLILSKFNFGEENLKINFAKALSLSLEFKLAAEILKTVVIRTLDEFIILSAVVILRVVITFVLHWEIKSSNQIKDSLEATE